MKPSTSTVALGLLLSLSAPCGVVMAAADPAEQLLLERAAFWRAQQRLDLTVATLNKVLALNPSQPDALYQLATLAVQRGDPGGAQSYFDRLRQMAASDPRAAELMRTPPQTAADSSPSVAAPPAALPAAATATVAANSSAPAAAPRVNPPGRKLPELAAVSADSDDLTAVVPSGPARVPAPLAKRVLAAASDNPTAKNVQSTSPTQGMVSDTTTEPPVTPAKLQQAASDDLGATAKPAQIAQLEMMPPPPVGGYQRFATAPYSPTDTLEIDIDRSLEQLEGQSNPGLLAGLGYRWHEGTSGLGELNEFGIPIEASFSPWYTGTLRLTVLPVYLDAGSISTGNLGQFGANPILLANSLSGISPGDQNGAGVGILGGYTYADFTGQFGTSPLGFPVTNLVGMAAYAPKFLDNTLTVRFEALRQPVTDTVLSYAGTHASLGGANGLTNGAFGTNDIWGGVVKTGGNISAFYDDQVYGAYGSAEWAALTGDNVPENREIDAFAGIYFRPWKTDDWAVRTGISLYYAGFGKDLDGYTFGQGGYFSPANLIALTFPVEYTGHTGPWSYLASVALGVQHFNADSSLVFPNNPNAQIALQALNPTGAVIGGSEGTGLAASLKGQLEYALDDTAAIGVSASYNNANQYNEVIAKLYLRKTFNLFSPNSAQTDPAAIARRDVPQSRL
jgi:hypothetical protein